MKTAETRALPGPGDWSLERLRGGSLKLDVALVSGVALVLGLVRLGAPSLWVDEAFTAYAVREHLVNPEDQYHWLYYAAITPWTTIAGTTEWALRFPSVVSATVACALLVVLARPVFGRAVALVSGVLLATSPFLVQWSQQARSYSTVLAVGILATLLLLRAMDKGSRAAWAVYGLAFSFVFVLQPVSALVLVPAHAVLAASRGKHVLPHALLAPCIVLVLGVPWAFARARQTPADNWLERPSPGDALSTLANVSGAFGLGLVLAIVGLFVLRRAGRTDLAVWLGAWAFGPFALALVASFLKPIYLDRYLITAAPGFALLAAVAILGVGVRARVALALIAAVATTIGLAHWYSTGTDGNWRGEGWEEAVATIHQRSTPEQGIVVVPWWAAPAATYYGARATSVSTADSIWVLSWSEAGHEIPRDVRRPLGFGSHQLVERHEFGWRVQAQLWRRSP